MAIKRGHIFIGTSNVVVPGNKTTFPPAFQSTSRLHYYSHLFNTVEINSSFYKTPLFSTYEKWSRDVPDDFRFSIKLSKEITHVKELKSDLALMDKFMQTAKGIGIKKGCLLIQFPGKITLDYFERVEQIMQELHQYDEANEWRKAVEFRNNSWYTGEAWELLDEFNAAMVLHDIPKSKMMDVRGKANFIYIRFHGPKGDYRDSYTDQFLKDRADEFKEWTKEGKDVYAYFNNTIGSAFENVMKLKEFLPPSP
ncbi:MAG: DUF72 domain-containing protein [Chitinophagaceae bacterium]